MLSLLAETSQIAANAIHFEDLGLRKGIDLGFFELRFYSLAYLAGIVLGYWHLTKMIKAPGSPLAQRHADDLFFWCTVGIILGGRLGYAAFYTGGETGIPSLFSRPLDLLKLWEGGMSFHGGVLGV
ncbi:MAG: prolipoprotein diacylglyceryl transferase family protein, partial [Tsuneonella troitsensis]